MAASYEKGIPNVHLLGHLARDQLKHLLMTISGVKDIVIDPGLVRPLDRLACLTLFKENQGNKIFKLDNGILAGGNSDTRFYFVRPFASNMRLIANHINSDNAENVKSRAYIVVMVPRIMYDCELLLEREGVFGKIIFKEFKLDLIPLDDDLLSLEIPSIFKSLFLHKNQTWIYTIAYSLWNLQSYFGKIPHTYGQGCYAKMVVDMFEAFCEELGRPKTLNNEIEYLFVFDRDVDYISVLLSQLTYEGLIDETFGIESGMVDLGSEIAGTNRKLKLVLTSRDEVFEEIRNKHISSVFNILSSKVKVVQSGYEKRHVATTIQDMKEFVGKELKNLQQQHKSLGTHIGTCESILNNKRRMDYDIQLNVEHALLDGTELRDNINYVEEAINRQTPPKLNLRLLCLLSCTQGGLLPQDYKNLQLQFLQSYGHNHLLTFFNLKKLGLLLEQESGILPSSASKLQEKMASVIPRKTAFVNIVKKLNLIPKSEENNLMQPENMSYVFGNAYIPLICRIIEEILKKDGLQSLTDVLKLLPPPTISQISAKSAKGSAMKASTGTGGIKSSSPQIVLVYFVGGCTFAEIAALRFLGLQKGYKFIIATTNIINGNKLMDLIFEENL